VAYRAKKITTFLIIIDVISLSLVSGTAGAYLASKFGITGDKGLNSAEVNNGEVSYAHALQEGSTDAVDEASNPAGASNEMPNPL